jgi:hypothetical protein
MRGLAPYVATGFAAALAVATLEFSVAGSVLQNGSLVAQPASSLENPARPSAGSVKGDRLTPRSDSDHARTVSTVELVGLRDVTTVLLRDAVGQVLYRSDPMSGVTVVTKGVVLPQITIREVDQNPPRVEPAETARQPDALPEGCTPAVSTIARVSASGFGVRCLTAREAGVKVAGLFY